jgi:hypothetical protein
MFVVILLDACGLGNAGLCFHTVFHKITSGQIHGDSVSQ